MLSGDTPPAEIAALLTPLEYGARQDLLAEGIANSAVQLQILLDMRYRGQSYELTIPWAAPTDDFLAAFHAAHHAAYGYSLPAVPIEIVNLRLHAVGEVEPISLPAHPPADPDPREALLGCKPVYLSALSPQTIPIYRGEALRPGNQLNGPALVVRRDTTILIGEGDTGKVDPFLNLIINLSRDHKNGRASLPGARYI